MSELDEERVVETREKSLWARIVLSVLSTRKELAFFILTPELTIILILSRVTSADTTLIVSLPSSRIPEALITCAPSAFL